MNLFQPFRQSPDASDFDRDEKMFNDASEYVDAIVERGTILREVPRLEKNGVGSSELTKLSHTKARQSAESAN